MTVAAIRSRQLSTAPPGRMPRLRGTPSTHYPAETPSAAPSSVRGRRREFPRATLGSSVSVALVFSSLLQTNADGTPLGLLNVELVRLTDKVAEFSETEGARIEIRRKVQKLLADGTAPRLTQPSSVSSCDSTFLINGTAVLAGCSGLSGDAVFCSSLIVPGTRFSV